MSPANLYRGLRRGRKHWRLWRLQSGCVRLSQDRVRRSASLEL